MSEASDIIYAAAHEDATLIFGAVVDPAMEGRVKITVIATGFDHAQSEAAPAAQATKTTPVDLTQYAVVAARPLVEERIAVNGGSRVIVNRRQALDLSGSRQNTAPTPMTDASDDAETSPLDVPAFLRRQEG